MANQAHLDLLLKCIVDRDFTKWDAWLAEESKKNPQFRLDLNGVDLFGADLSEVNLGWAHLNEAGLHEADLFQADLFQADLRGANLRGATLRKANLSGADLSRANLRAANLSGAVLVQVAMNRAELYVADLRGANLHGANLSDANLREADLTGADLSEADLRGANLRRAALCRANLVGADLDHADLGETDLNGAVLDGTNLASTILNDARLFKTHLANVDLSDAKGLDTIKHNGPSTIGIDTLYQSRGNIPESFLRGCGVPEPMITFARSFVGKSTEYGTVFIARSIQDKPFADRLYADLQAQGMRVWFAPEDLKFGAGTDEATRYYDKFIVILSESSIASAWVEQEVLLAQKRERKQQRSILFPVRLDDAIMESTSQWATTIRDAAHMADFSQWKQYDEYQKALSSLLHDLLAESRTQPPAFS